MRTAKISRKTKETEIEVNLSLDGGEIEIDTGIGFFDHMLTAFMMHGGFGGKIICKGDIEVDAHHSVEDVGIVLGKAFDMALGDKGGIKRYGSFAIPMDEALCKAILDISGRPFLVFNAEFSQYKTGEFDLCLVEEFFRAFAMNSKITLHINLEYGKNAHHEAEAMFKAVAHALRKAVKLSKGTLSTKGSID
ncbi:MAG: imidazoleglycerol-phosphate dehydratase HisB [Clostridia bacterium]|nr:imidazoleglycerol-phosphate dehydratase HisB [Clostridia bacterium]